MQPPASTNSSRVRLSNSGSFWSSLFGRAERPRASIDTNQEFTQAIDYLRGGLEWCLSISGARRVLLWRLDEPNSLVRVRASAGGAAPQPHVLHGSPITWLARERISARLEPAPDWAESMRVIGLPVLEEVSQHVLTLELADDLEVSPSQFDALGIYMGALLNVVHDHQLLAEHQTRTEHLIDALRVLPAASNVATLGRELVGAALRLTNGTGAALCAWDGEVGEVLYAESGGLAVGSTFGGTDSLTAMAARGTATISREASQLRSLRLLGQGERFAITPASAIAVPLLTHGEVVAVLTVWSPRRIQEASVSSLETLAPYAAAQLRHARELGAMRTLAERDALTGLHNRRAFDHHFNAEAARFERYRRPFALILMDIDFFKKVNDQYGHDGGDEVLRKVGEIVSTSLRDVDIAARYGGEEFALLLPETDKSDAIEIAERIRKRIEATPVDFRGTPISVTSSAGVAAMPERNVEVANLVRVADQLLYEAKRQGRNRVVTVK